MTFSFTANKRGKEDASVLRAGGKLPAVLYGQGLETVSLILDYNSFMKLYNEAGESSLIDLSIDGPSAAFVPTFGSELRPRSSGRTQGESIKVLIQDLQQDPVKGVITHVDFRQINMNKEMHATVELVFIGESAAVKELGGTLVKAKDTVEVKCLPKDLVSEIQVDLGVLKTFDDVVHVKDLVLPAGIALSDDSNTVIVKVARPLSEDELKAMEEQGPKSVEEVEVEKKGKEEIEGEGEGEKGEEKAPTGDKKPAGDKKKE